MRAVIAMMFALLAWPPAWADACREALDSLEAPLRLKSHDKPRRARWGDMDKILNRAAEVMQDRECSLTFGQLFDVRDDQPLIPLTNTLLRLVPEESLLELGVYDRDGDLLGNFAGRAVYERTGGLHASRSYRLFFFQYRTSDGELRSSGHDLLLDRFLVRWEDVRDRPVLAPPETEVIQ